MVREGGAPSWYEREGEGHQGGTRGRGGAPRWYEREGEGHQGDVMVHLSGILWLMPHKSMTWGSGTKVVQGATWGGGGAPRWYKGQHGVGFAAITSHKTNVHATSVDGSGDVTGYDCLLCQRVRWYQVAVPPPRA